MQTLKEKRENRSDEQKKSIFGYGMYDWAKSAYETSVVTAILPAWFTYLFIRTNGSAFTLLGDFTITADIAWAFATMASAMLIAFVSPALGIIADRTTIKMWMLRLFTIIGVVGTVALAIGGYLGAGAWLWVWVAYFFANLGLNGASVFYNAILPHMGDEDEMDEISNKAFAYGYLGGGILLLIHLVMVLSLSGDWVIPFTLVSSGLWWYGFAYYTFKHIPEPEVENPLEITGIGHATKIALSELRQTVKEISKFKVLTIYMIAYFLFIDGINSVTALAGSFGSAVLGIDIGTLMLVIMIVQFVAAPAAIGFTKMAEATSTKSALTMACVGWCVVVVLAVGFAPLELESHSEYDVQLTYNETTGEYDVMTISDPDDLFGGGASDKAILEVFDTDSASLPTMKEGGSWPDDAIAGSISQTAIDSGFTGLFSDSRFSASIEGSPSSDSTTVGLDHPTNIGDEAGDGFAVWLRDNFWAPLSFTVSTQFLMLGVMSGSLLGGSQGLARSLFCQIIPETRSTEFFGFFGFFGKVAAFMGPLLYAFVGGFFGSRMALVSIALLIVAGTLMLKAVDVEEGIRVAAEEDLRNRGFYAEAE
jgi:UMF1 family MFS transporter